MEPEKSIIKEFLDGGWVITIIGAAAMIARILSVRERSNIIENIKKILVAAISSSIMWSLIHDLNIKDYYEAMIYGVTGVISPEIIQGVVKLGKKFSKNPEKYIVKK